MDHTSNNTFMKIHKAITISSAILATMSMAQAAKDHLVFKAKGKANGKHVVLLAGDEEYRSEESMPMLGQILANNGFNCTVLFSLDKNNKFIDPGNQKHLSNPVSLDSADAIVMGLRFRNWNDEAFEKFNAAFERGVPVVAVRTSTHAFKVPKDSKFHKYSFNSKIPEKGNEKHSVLNGVGPIFAKSDVYGANPLKPSTILLRGAVTETLDPSSKPIAGDKNAPMMPVAWVRDYKHESGKVSKIVTTTMGSADDLLDEDLRRLVVNGVYWGLDMKVPAKADVSFQNAYVPTFYGFKDDKDGIRKGYRKNHTPEDLIKLESLSVVDLVHA